jgi:maleate isomerase
MVTSTSSRTRTSSPLLVNKTHLPHQLDQGLGSRLRIGLIELATDQTSEHEFRRILALPGVDFYQSRIWNDATITPETLSRMEKDIQGAMRLILPSLRLDVAGFTCTSGAMVIGEDQVFALMRKSRPGIPCSSPITGAMAGSRSTT